MEAKSCTVRRGNLKQSKYSIEGSDLHSIVCGVVLPWQQDRLGYKMKIYIPLPPPLLPSPPLSPSPSLSSSSTHLSSPSHTLNPSSPPPPSPLPSLRPATLWYRCERERRQMYRTWLDTCRLMERVTVCAAERRQRANSRGLSAARLMWFTCEGVRR